MKPTPLLLCLAVCATAVTAAAGAANAQDRWSGFYAGVSAGQTSLDGSLPGNSTHSYNQRDRVPGLYAGYLTTGANGLTWGPDISFQKLSLSQTRSDASLGSSTLQGSYIVSPRVRAGFATDTMFFYGVAGVSVTDAGIRPTANTDTTVHIGGTYGIGMEYALSDDWSTRIEATQYTRTGTSYDFNGTNTGGDLNVQSITVGLTKKF